MADKTLTYKGKPLVRSKNELYYGDPNEAAIVFLQILSTKQEAGEEVADRVHLTMLSTDETKSPKDRILRQTDKIGLYTALDFASIWLEKLGTGEGI